MKGLTAEQEAVIKEYSHSSPNLAKLKLMKIPYVFCTDLNGIIAGIFDPVFEWDKIFNHVDKMKKRIDAIIKLLAKELRLRKNQQDEKICFYSAKERLADAVSQRISTVELL
ncbi:MAG: hypothetical protein GY839_18800 [candidate division Zixibacteria bacterium]|nr:hypothetical protein [candidate division Zixibacteria bacterium]